MLVEVGRGRDQAEAVLDAVPAQRRRATKIGEDLRDGSTEPAQDIVLLHGEQRPGAAGGGDHRVAVQRLDRVHVDQPDGAPGRTQRIHRLERRTHHRPAGEDRELRALEMGDCLADFEREVFAINHRIMAARDAEIDRARVGDGGPDRGGELRAVGRRDNREVRDAAHGREVLRRMMRGAVEAERDSRMVPHEPNRQGGVGAVGADLLAAQEREIGGEGRREGHQPGAGDAGGGGDHVLLGDPELQEALGEAAGEADQPVGVLQVRGAGDHGMARLGQLDQRVGQGGEARGAGIELAVLPALGAEGAHAGPPPAVISASTRASSSGAR